MTVPPTSIQMEAQTPFYAVAQSTPDAIVSADAEGLIIFWNNAAEAIFGYTQDEVLGQPITILMSDTYQGSHLKGMQRFQETGEPTVIGTIVELHGLRKNGVEFPIELSLSTWTEEGKQYFNGIIRDITARKEAERTLHEYAQTLEERNRELYAYDRTIAHDLKNPLHLVQTYADLILMQFEGQLPDRAQEHLRRILRASKTMAEMVDQLLAMALMRERNAAILEPVDTQDVLREIQHDHLRQFIERENVTLMVAQGLPHVVAHRVWVKQIFANLITNAIKYKGKDNDNPWIKVRGLRVGDMARFEVEDNGLGIPESEKHQLFDAFWRMHENEAEGYGVGLSIVHRLVQRLNGEIGVDSEPGHGSTFWFVLPAAE